MQDAALADEFKTQHAFIADSQVIVLERRDAVRPISSNAALSAHTKVERIDQPHHYRQHLFARKTVKHDMLVGQLAKPRKVLAKPFDLCEFSLLRPFSKTGMITILHATCRIYANRLDAAASRGIDPNKTPCGRHDERIDPFQRRVVTDVRSEET